MSLEFDKGAVVPTVVQTAVSNQEGRDCPPARDERPRPGTPLPRPKRKPRRPKSDRGLPPDEELAKLATAYLERQRKQWPTLFESGLLPEAQSDIVHQMV